MSLVARVPALIAPSLRLAKVTVVPDPGGPLTAGTATIGTVAADQVTGSATDASGGTPPYDYQWERSTSGPSSGFSDLSGQTSLSFDDQTVSPETSYWYRLRYMDADSAVTFSNVLEATTPASGGGSTAPQPPAAGAPNMIQNDGPILFDIRPGAVANNGGSFNGPGGDINDTTNLSEMEALYASDSWGVGEWEWSTYGGQNKTRIPYFDCGCQLCEQQSGARIRFVDPVDEYYARWRTKFGRAAADAGTTHGAIDAFQFNNDCSANNWGRKEALSPRVDNFPRVDIIFFGPAGGTVGVSSDQLGTVWPSSYDYRLYEGEEVEFVWHLRRETGGGGNGIIELWSTITGQATQKLIDVHDAVNGFSQFTQFQAPSVQANRPIDMTEYIWDITCWVPEE